MPCDVVMSADVRLAQRAVQQKARSAVWPSSVMWRVEGRQRERYLD